MDFASPGWHVGTGAYVPQPKLHANDEPAAGSWPLRDPHRTFSEGGKNHSKSISHMSLSTHTSEQAAWKELYLGSDDYREALNDTEVIEQHDNAGLRECIQAQGPLLWEQIVIKVVKSIKDRECNDLEWLGRKANWFLVKAIFHSLDMQHLLLEGEEWSSTGITEILYLLGEHKQNLGERDKRLAEKELLCRTEAIARRSSRRARRPLITRAVSQHCKPA